MDAERKECAEWHHSRSSGALGDRFVWERRQVRSWEWVEAGVVLGGSVGLQVVRVSLRWRLIDQEPARGASGRREGPAAKDTWSWIQT